MRARWMRSAGLSLSLVGCMSLAPQGTPRAVSLSPRGTSELRAPDPVRSRVARPTTPTPAEPTPAEPPRPFRPDIDVDGPIIPGDSVPVKPRPDSGDGPEIRPPSVPPSRELELTVQAPAQEPVHGQALVAFTVHNPHPRAVEEVTLILDLDPPLQVVGHKGRIWQQSVGRLEPLESKEVRVRVRSDSVGPGCARARLEAEEMIIGRRAACISFVPRELSPRMVGPTRRVIGHPAEFTLDIVNTTDRTLKNLTVTLTHDRALTPSEASAGVLTNGNRLTWNIAELAAQTGQPLQVEFECVARSEQSTLQWTVTGPGLPDEHGETSLVIAAPHPQLDLQLVDSVDPVKFDQETVFTFRLKNTDLQALKQVVVRARLTESLKFASAKVRRGEQELMLVPQVDGETIRFPALAEFAGEVPLIIELRAKGGTSGVGECTFSVTHADDTLPVTITEPTLVRP